MMLEYDGTWKSLGSNSNHHATLWNGTLAFIISDYTVDWIWKHTKSLACCTTT